MITEQEIRVLLEKQNQFFKTGTTLDISWRICQLKKLKRAILNSENEIENALAEDLGRAPVESYFCDIGAVIREINEMLFGIRKWAKPETLFSGFACFPSTRTRIYKMPYGAVLIISPFNFPFNISFSVLVSAIAGGNTAVIKASSKSPACTAVLKKIIGEIFPEEYCAVLDGGHEVADLCLAQRFDKIFYTGSPAVGKHVMAEAAKNLIPVALELGGENGNWAIVRRDADLRDAARKIAFFKTLNAGQICIDINQVAVAKEVAPQFLECLKDELRKQAGEGHAAVFNPEYPKLISEAAYDKCAEEAEQYRGRIIFGGCGDRKTCRYAPTVIYPVKTDEPIVLHELFSPLLPVVEFEDEKVEELLALIASREHSLALYLFTGDLHWAESVMRTQQYGGGCINEVCLHMLVKGAPFNGTGHSGMGAYHGEWGFREFTHPSTVLTGRTVCNLPLRMHPYGDGKTNWKLKLIKLFER